MNEREKLKQLKKMAQEREDWVLCKELRQKIFDYDAAHPDEPSLALEVSLTKMTVEQYYEILKKEKTELFNPVVSNQSIRVKFDLT